jgi:branched-chain amino acid transport system substrate-binding protein
VLGFFVRKTKDRRGGGDNVSIGAGIQFNAKGQNDKVGDGATQNRAGKNVVLAPKAAANAKPEWPMRSYLSRA